MQAGVPRTLVRLQAGAAHLRKQLEQAKAGAKRVASEGERLRELEAQVTRHETQEAALRSALTSSEARIAELEEIVGPGVEDTLSSLRWSPSLHPGIA